MKKALLITAIFLGTFIAAILLNPSTRAKAAYLFDKHIIAGGLSGSDGIPLKVEADGTLYLCD